VSDPSPVSLHGLNQCDCCAGVTAETPADVLNRPGLSAIAYRVGTQSAFKASLLAALSDATRPALLPLRTRDDDDFSIALLDAAATMADVLTFYQERIANESYLRTATERRSLLELARLIGYELRPGVAAGTYLAFTIEDAPGAPRRTTIDMGTKVQSIPGPGEKPQTFETIANISADALWNAMKPMLTQPQPISTGMSSILFKGLTTRLSKGDVLLIVAPDASGAVDQKLRRVAEVKEDHPKQQTAVTLVPLTGSGFLVVNTSIGLGHFSAGKVAFNNDTVQNQVLNQSWNTSDLDAFARMQGFAIDDLYQVIANRLRRRQPPPNTTILAMRKRAALFGYNAPDWNAMADTTHHNYGGGNEWPLPTFDNSNQLYLDQVYKEIKPNDWVIVSCPGKSDVIAQIDDAQESAAAWFAISGQVTRIIFGRNVDVKPASMDELRQTRVYIIPEALLVDDLPDLTPIQASPLRLDGPVQGLVAGHTIMISGTRADADGVIAAEVAQVSEVRLDGGSTSLTLVNDLQHPYVRNTVSINGNVAPATHGETVQEVLGAGDASRPSQSFMLRQLPLTYVSAANAGGAESTLQVRANDLLWHEAPTLYGRGPLERIYVTRRNHAGNTTVQFGDGVTGARLPSGQNNVRALYRKGIGLEGLVKRGQLSLLLTRPLGVKTVTNPLDATGAQDPEQLEDARRSAPLTVLTLDRTVSLQDYGDFARSFAGVAKALATWTWDGQARGVFVTVAGPAGAAVTSDSATYRHLLAAMQAAGDPFVRLQVKSYQPMFFRLSGTVKVDQDFESEHVLAAISQALRTQFSFEARTFGQPVMLSEVIAVIQAVPGVVALDVDKLYRSDAGVATLEQRLLAELPVVLSTGDAIPAELLTLDPAPLDNLGVLT
jgi:hypothetical protein